MTTTAIRTLDALADVLRKSPQGNMVDAEDFAATIAYAGQHGLPVAHGEIDWTSLPTFGGEAPSTTDGVWSWDETRLLVGTCAEDVKIVERSASDA